MIMIIHSSPDQADLEKGKEERAVGHMLEHVPEFKYASIAFNREFEDKSESLNHFQQHILINVTVILKTLTCPISLFYNPRVMENRLIKEYANNVYTLYLNL